MKSKSTVDRHINHVKPPFSQWIGLGEIETGNPHDLHGKNHGFNGFRSFRLKIFP